MYVQTVGLIDFIKMKAILFVANNVGRVMLITMSVKIKNNKTQLSGNYFTSVIIACGGTIYCHDAMIKGDLVISSLSEVIVIGNLAVTGDIIGNIAVKDKGQIHKISSRAFPPDVSVNGKLEAFYDEES